MIEQSILFCVLCMTGMLSIAAQEPVPVNNDKVQKIRFIEDDAQNYMVSKIYELKHQKANDIVPFILGAIKRYAKNGHADRINYSEGKQQLVAVSCPTPLVPYIDDMIEKLDRPGIKDQNNSGIDGSGIIRSVYTPVWRSSEEMVKIMKKTGIPANADEGDNQDAVVAFDVATNRIYWKDSIKKDQDLKKYLVWLDRPVPQCDIMLNIYEVRESDLLDLGLDYLAWKNGPALNLFDVGATFLEGSTITEAFGPYGFFMFAPSFDLSFVRLLQQNGKAKLATSASLTVTTGHNGELSFSPEYQNLKKDDKFASSVDVSSNYKLELNLIKPVISFNGTPDIKTGLIGYTEKDYAEQVGILNFQYTLNLKNVVERDNYGNELYESFSTAGSITVKTETEQLLTQYVQESETEQTIGVPFLCELPILKYIFGTTTKNKEKVIHFISVKARLRHPDTDIASISGKLVSITELVNPKQEEK